MKSKEKPGLLLPMEALPIRARLISSLKEHGIWNTKKMSGVLSSHRSVNSAKVVCESLSCPNVSPKLRLLKAKRPGMLIVHIESSDVQMQ